MADTPEAAGYIVHDNEGVVHGYGASADAAWDDMLQTMAQSGIAVLPAAADSTLQLGAWTRENGLKILPATAALLALIESDGGDCTWGRATIGGVACTQAEEQADPAVKA